LLLGNSIAVKFGNAKLPFVYQFPGLTRAPLGTGSILSA
jgi:hypothetical protein